MKLSKIAKLVKRYGVLDVYRVNQYDVWLGVAGAIYKCAGLPLIYGERNARAVLGLTADEFSKINFSERDIDMQKDDGFVFHDTDRTETAANELDSCAVIGGTAFNILECHDGNLIFYNEDLLSPLGAKYEQYSQLCARETENGMPYIAVKNGFFLEAVVMPIKMDLNSYVKKLDIFRAKLVDQLVINAELEAEAQEDQLSMEGAAHE